MDCLVVSETVNTKSFAYEIDGVRLETGAGASLDAESLAH